MRKIKLHSTSGFTPLEITESSYSKNKRSFPLSLTGFTLLETAIAIFISTLVVTSSLYAFNRSLSLIQAAKDMNIALNFARSACEQARQEGSIESRSYYTPVPNDNYFVKIMPEEIKVSWITESDRQRFVIVNIDFIQRSYS
jgi:Tfp pilus assembly protein PilV